MNLSNIIIQGGLMNRAADEYDETQAQRGHAARVREHGVKTMQSSEKRMAAQDSLLDKDTELKRIKQDIDAAEAAWVKSNQGTDQRLRQSDLEHRARMQPGQQQIDTDTQAVQQGQVANAKKLQPGQNTIASEGQNVQLQALRESQVANVYGMLKLGDTKGALDALNKSEIIFPGRKFSAIERGAVPARGPDGKPVMGKDGKPASETMIRLKSADGERDEFVPERALEQLHQKHKSSTVKVGNNLVRQNPDGTVTPLYEQDQFMAVPEDSSVVSKRTGEPPAAASGTRAPGTGAKTTKKMDERVKMAGQHIDKYFGINEFTRLDDKNQVSYNATKTRTESLVRNGADPFQAANQAVLEDRDGRLKPDGTLKGPGTPAAPGAAPGGAPAQPAALPKLW